MLSSNISGRAHQSPGQRQHPTAPIDGDPRFILRSKFAHSLQLFPNPSPEFHLLVVVLQSTSIRPSIREEYEKKLGAHLIFPGIPRDKGAGEKFAWPK